MKESQYAIIASITGVLFVSTFISESLLFPFITGKNLIFRILILISVLLCAYFVYTKKKLTTLTTPVHIAFTAFVGILLLADLQGINPVRSLFSNFERMEGWFTHLMLFLFFLLLTQVVQKLEVWRTIAKISLIANAYVVLFALSQYYGTITIFQSSDRIDGTLGNATYLAGYSMMYVFLLAWLAYTSRSHVAKYGYGFLALVNTFVIFVSLTRGGVVGLIAGVSATLLLIVLFEKSYVYLRRVALASIAIFVVLGSLLFVNKDSGFVTQNPVLNRIASMSNLKSLDSRLDVWSISYDGLKERPLLGWGQENFLYVFSKHFDPSMGEREPWFDRSHNVFFDWLIAAGMFGILGYLALFAASLYVMWFARKSKQNFSIIEKALWTGFLVSYFIFNLFVFDNVVSYILFVFVLGYITWKGYLEKSTNDVVLRKEMAQVITFVLVVIGITGIIFLVYKPWKTAKTLIEGMQYSEAALVAPTDAQAQAWSKQILGTAYTKAELIAFGREKFTQATQYPLGRTEAREQFAQKFVSVVINQNVSGQEKNEWAKLVFTELEDELKKDPFNPRIYQLTGTLLLQIGKTAEAIDLLNKAQELAPKKQLIMFDRVVAYQLAGDYEKALEISKQAYELNPSFLRAKALYLASLYRAGKDAQALDLESIFVEEASAQGYDVKGYSEQAMGAKIDFRATKAVEAYQKGDMATYAKYVAEIKALSPESATKLVQLINSRK